MRRLIITLTIVAGCFLPALATAERVATGTTRKAVIRALASKDIPARCLIVQVTTKDGGNWAEVAFNAAHYHSCTNWILLVDGIGIAHRTHGRWHRVTGGSAISCRQFGIPRAVQRDLHLPCMA
jgi:hypothetical protein